ncbi:MAG: anticodon nuclease, partial [Anaerolineales bacterium]|nr:anticodon nuclease [Anaerolineales bacterium]
KILYYNAFTEDLFYWDNDLERDNEPKLKIQPNDFTKWVLQDQGQDQNIVAHFQRYTDTKLSPRFSPDFSEVTFSLNAATKNKPKTSKFQKVKKATLYGVYFIVCLCK